MLNIFLEWQHINKYNFHTHGNKIYKKTWYNIKMCIIKILLKWLNNYRNSIYFKVLSCSLVKRDVILKQISQKVRLNRIKCYHFKVNESTVLKKIWLEA